MPPRDLVVPILQESRPHLTRAFVRFRRAPVYKKPDGQCWIRASWWHFRHFMPSLWVPFFKQSLATHQTRELRATFLARPEVLTKEHQEDALSDIDRIEDIFPELWPYVFAVLSLAIPVALFLIGPLRTGINHLVATKLPSAYMEASLVIPLLMLLYIIPIYSAAKAESDLRKLYEKELRPEIWVTYWSLHDPTELADFRQPFTFRFVLFVSIGVTLVASAALFEDGIRELASLN